MIPLLMVDDRYHPHTTSDARKYQDDLLSASLDRMLLTLTECIDKRLCDYEGDELILINEDKWRMADFYLMDELKSDILSTAAKVWAANRKAYNGREVWININLGFRQMNKMSTLDQFRYLKDNCPEVACYLYHTIFLRPSKAYAIMAFEGANATAQIWADCFWRND